MAARPQTGIRLRAAGDEQAGSTPIERIAVGPNGESLLLAEGRGQRWQVSRVQLPDAHFDSSTHETTNHGAFCPRVFDSTICPERSAVRPLNQSSAGMVLDDTSRPCCLWRC